MCLAVPLKIISIEKRNAEAELDGIVRKIRLDFLPDANVGDYVIVHAGFAIQRLDKEIAEENLRAIKEVADALQE